MAWTSPTTYSSGHVVTASDWNAQVTGNMNYLNQFPFGTSWAADVTCTSASTVTPTMAQGELHDGFTFGSSLLTAPLAGLYLVVAAIEVEFTALAAFAINAVINGSAVGLQWGHIAGGFPVATMGQYIGSYSAGATFRPQVYTNSGNTEYVNLYMTVCYLGAS